MCKRKPELSAPSDNRENSNTNVGIINVSDQSFGDGITGEMIATYIITFIVVIMVFKWIRKYCNRRQARHRDMLMDMANSIPLPALPAQQQPQPLAIPPAAPVHQPVIPYILHHDNQGYKRPAIEALESSVSYGPVNKMEKYRL